MVIGRRTTLAALAAGTLLPPWHAPHAQPAPGSGPPIRVIVPFPAGGTTDLLARLFAQRMTETLGQSVVIENRGGAGGSIGADVVAKAAPDGTTLLFHNITFPTTTAAMTLAGRAPHDLERDFAPVSLAANVPLILLAHPGVGATDLPGFITAARAASTAGRPLFYGSTGPGSLVNLVGEVMQHEAGLRMEHIPFRGAAPLVQELLTGRVQLGGDQLSTSLGHVRSGGLRGLAVLSAARSPALPDVPTVREAGMPTLELEGWNGFFAPARTPAPVLRRLGEAVAAAARDPGIVQRCADVAAEPVGSSAEAFATLVNTQYAHVRDLVASVQLRPE